MKKQTKSLTEIHIAVLLFGLAGLFGEISLPATSIVFGRVFFATITLGLVIAISKQRFYLRHLKDYSAMIILGLVLAVHWVTLFHAIQLSTVAIGVLTFSTFTVFTTFIEPLVFKEKLKTFDVIIACVALAGVAIIVPKFTLGNNMTQGALWGTLSGFLFAVLSVLNRKYVKSYSGVTIAFYEELVAALVLLPFILHSSGSISLKDILLLVLLGVVFSALSHTLFIRGLGNVKTQRASVITTLEPVYGVLFAFLLFKQVPSARTFIGGAVILAVALIASTQHSRLQSQD